MSTPPTMKALVAPRKCPPSNYQVMDMPTPVLTLPTHVLIQVHAAAVEPGELQAINSPLASFANATFPYKIGIEGSGIVVSTGSDVKTFKPGDKVFAAVMDKPSFRVPWPGFVAEYVVVEERFLLHKPPTVSFEEAASMAGGTVTAVQTIRRALQLAGLEDLQGKTVFVPAALGATGSIAIQVAKRVFGAEKVISTVSTAKVSLVEEKLPGMVDTLVDYQTQRLEDHVPRGSVDFMLNTNWATLSDGIPLVNPETGVIVSIAGVPTKETMREILGDKFSWWMGLVLDVLQVQYWWKIRGTSIKYDYVSGGPHIREDLERAGELIALGRVRPVVRVVDLCDLETVRKGCEETWSGKGGVGKCVIRIGAQSGGSV